MIARVGKISLVFLLLISFIFCPNPPGDTNIDPNNPSIPCDPTVPVNAPASILISSHIPFRPGPNPYNTGFFMAIDSINADECILPGTTLMGVANATDPSPVAGLEAFLYQAQVLHAVANIGAGSSSISRAVATASPLFQTPQISYASTLAELSNKDTYPYFNRVVPSDAFQGKLLARLFSYFGWDRVSVLFTSDSYGASISETFTNEATALGVRFLSTQSFPRGSAVDSVDLLTAMENTKSSGSKIVFMAMLAQDGHQVMKVAKQIGLDKVNYIVSDGVAQENLFNDPDTGNFSQEVFDQSLGMIGMIPRRAQGPLYDEWLVQWEALPDDTGAGSNPPPLFVPFLRDATYSAALALDRIVRAGLNVTTSGPELLDEIRLGPSFEGLTGPVSYDAQGDRFAFYDILNQRGNVNAGGFEVIGSANEQTGLEFTIAPIFSDNTTKVPDSANLIYVDYSDPEGIAMVVLCSIGIIATLISAVIVLANHATPIVAFSSPRFVFVIALGICLGYANVFVWTGKPSDELCQARPWILLMGLAFVLGNLYAKTCRIYYLMNSKAFVLKPIKDSILFSFVGAYCIFFVVPLIVWTVSYPLEAVRKNNNPDHDKANLMCDGDNADAFFIYFLVISLISIVFGVVISFLIRNIHDFFSEMEYIAYTLYTACITAAVVLPMLFLLDDDPVGFYIVFVLGCFFANSAALVFLFFPKMFVILIRPEENVLPTGDDGRLVTSKSKGTSGGTSNTTSVE